MNSALKLLAAAAALGTCISVSAQQVFPSRPITILDGFPAGGNPDIAARLIASALEARLGQPVVVENRSGASGTIAASAVARAKPDGHTLLLGVAANLAVAPATMRERPYDPTQAFTPIIEIARGPYILLVRSDAPAKNFGEFIAWAKSNPGKLNYVSPGLGTAHHLTTEMLKRATGIDIVHVPYRESPYRALLAGEVQATFQTMPGPLPHLQSGKIRALAVTGARRLPSLPDVPTLAELGVAGVDTNFWWGIVAPAGTPPAIVDKLNREIVQALTTPEMAAAFAKWSIAPTGGSPEAFGAQIAQEYVRWKEFAAGAGLQLE